MSDDFWSLILIFGLFGWIVSSIIFMFRAFPEKDVFSPVAGVRWGSAMIVSFAVWVVGMLNA